MSHIDEIRSFIAENCLRKETPPIADDSDLFELGLLDSLAMIKLFDFVERRFDVEVPDSAMMEPERFATISLIAGFVAASLPSPVQPIS